MNIESEFGEKKKDMDTKVKVPHKPLMCVKPAHKGRAQVLLRYLSMSDLPRLHCNGAQ